MQKCQLASNDAATVTTRRRLTGLPGRRFATWCASVLIVSVSVLEQTTGQELPSPPPQSMELGSFDVVYENVQPINQDFGPYGRLTITQIANQSLNLVQNHILGPCACLSFPIISKYRLRKSSYLKLGKDEESPSEFLLLVGTDGGHHTTMRVVREWQDGPSVAALDIDQTEPNIAWDPDVGGYIVRVEREELFRGDAVHQSYLMIYKLYVDDATTAFVPVFGASVAHIYLDRYRHERSAAKSNPGASILPMVAALVATDDSRTICSVLQSLKRDGFSATEIERSLTVVTAAGFPHFFYSSCEAH